MNVGRPTSKFRSVFLVAKVRVPVIDDVALRARRGFHLPDERDGSNDLDLSTLHPIGEAAIGCNYAPSPPLRRALHDEVVRGSTGAEHHGHRAEMPRETGRLRAVENARDARAIGSRKPGQQSHEPALPFLTMTVDAHRAEDIA